MHYSASKDDEDVFTEQERVRSGSSGDALCVKDICKVKMICYLDFVCPTTSGASTDMNCVRNGSFRLMRVVQVQFKLIRFAPEKEAQSFVYAQIKIECQICVDRNLKCLGIVFLSFFVP